MTTRSMCFGQSQVNKTGQAKTHHIIGNKDREVEELPAKHLNHYQQHHKKDDASRDNPGPEDNPLPRISGLFDCSRYCHSSCPYAITTTIWRLCDVAQKRYGLSAYQQTSRLRRCVTTIRCSERCDLAR